MLVLGSAKKNGSQWKKKWFNDSLSKPQIQIGLGVSKKLYETYAFLNG